MIKIELPLHTVSEANAREHWAIKSKRVKTQRNISSLAVRNALLSARIKRERDLKYSFLITLTRFGKRNLDSDNLQSSFKAVRDGVADALQINDGSERLTWVYAQEKSKEYSIRIEIV